MQRRGLIIRFIDIGLLILFGFLMISDLDHSSQIRIPGKLSWDELMTDGEQVQYLGISIKENDDYDITALAEKQILHGDLKSPEELQFFLKTLKDRYESEGKSLSVLIEPAPDSRMQRLIEVLDVCERLGIQRSINLDSTQSGTIDDIP